MGKNEYYIKIGHMSDFDIVLINVSDFDKVLIFTHFNEYYTQIVTVFKETDAEQIQIQTVS